MATTPNDNDSNKPTKATLLTIPKDIELVRWINYCKVNGETGRIKREEDILTGETNYSFDSSMPDKEYDPKWPIFVGYPFTRQIKEYNPQGQFTGYRMELINSMYYEKEVIESGKRKKSLATPVPFELIPLMEDRETQCIVCVRSDVYER